MYIHSLKIGNIELENNLILAPMAGVTNLPFRIICKEVGNPGLVCTEMASSRGMFHNDEKLKGCLTQKEKKDQYLFKYLVAMKRVWNML